MLLPAEAGLRRFIPFTRGSGVRRLILTVTDLAASASVTVARRVSIE